MPKKFSGAGSSEERPTPPANNQPTVARRKRRRERRDFPRIPPTVDGIQVNHCSNVECENFGVELRQDVTRGGTKRGVPRVSDGHRVVGGRGESRPKRLLCLKCRQSSTLKSNQGVKEELDRISAYLRPAPRPSCPNSRCENHGASVDVLGRYYGLGATSEGGRRHRCRSCVKVFSEERRRRKQRLSHGNREIFLALVRKQGQATIRLDVPRRTRRERAYCRRTGMVTESPPLGRDAFTGL